MKAVKSTGLVPVIVGRRIFGVSPQDAIKGLKSASLELYDIPEGIETIDVVGYEPVAEAKVETVISTDGLVEIPDDWRTVHGTKRAFIAKAILGIGPKDRLPVAEGQDIAEYAVSVIEAELARRVAPNPDNETVKAADGIPVTDAAVIVEGTTDTASSIELQSADTTASAPQTMPEVTG